VLTTLDDRGVQPPGEDERPGLDRDVAGAVILGKLSMRLAMPFLPPGPESASVEL
jgi:hypothetical protein